MKKMSNWKGALLGVLVLTVLAACSAAPATPTAAPAVPAAPVAAEPTATTQAAAPAAAASTSLASLTVENTAGVDIWYVYISPSSSSDWGTDQLGSNIIAAGSSYTIADIPAGTYDLLAEDSNHNAVGQRMAVALSGAITWTVTGPGASAPASTVSLTIINNSGMNIFYVYISPTSSAQWGDDQLGANTIPAGSTFTINGIPAGMYDLKAEDSSHNVIALNPNSNLSANAEWTITP